MIDVDEAKLYMRVDHEETDFEIQQMIDSAVEYFASIGVNTTADPLPAPLYQAALMLVHYFYESRGVDSNDSYLSPVFMRLVAPFRKIEL